MLDTKSLHAALALASTKQQVAFAAASLDLLVRRFGRQGPGRDRIPPDLLDDAVSICWRSVPESSDDPSETEALYSRAAGILEEDDEGRLFEGEHVLAGVCYALRSVELRDAGYAVLVASNLYEAADYAAIIEDSNFSDEEILARPVVVAALQAIQDLLERVLAVDLSSDGWEAELQTWTSSVDLAE